ncbi:MAG TPA: type IV toxin-antitoxin system AbiEi family antitoxin domain-containing protein [Acidimicrobiia bacterium]
MGNLGGIQRDSESSDLAIGRFAGSQHGVFSRVQAIALGVSPRQIQRRLSQGRWDSPFRGVYRIVGSGDDRQAVMGAALWAGAGALVSHGAAGVLWGIDGVRAPKLELWVPTPRNPRCDEVIVHRGERLDRADRTTLGAIPITTPIRTLIDVAGRLEDDPLLAAMESVFRRKLGTPERLAARLGALRDSGRPGAGRLAALLAARGRGGPLESVLEAKVWRLLTATALPRPVRQHWVTTPAGRYRLDFAWPERKLALECDGWEHHGGTVAFGKDRERLSELVSIGWRVLLITWQMGARQPRRVVRWVELSLAA